jgi:2-polyprenyl-3-methyl-5-hydroxy-6-metoxy-1,4-benzoquinol methylase
MSDYNGVFNLDEENTCWTNAFNLINKNSYVLDIGCSNGNFGKALIDNKNCLVDGIEPDLDDFRSALKVLSSVYNCTIEEAIAKINDKKYDHIVLLDVIEHLVDPVEVLKTLSPLLKKGGSIVYSIPNMAHAIVRINLLSGDFNYGNTGLLDKTHLHFYNYNEVNRVFNDAGYKIITENNVYKVMPNELVMQALDFVGIDANTKIEEIFDSEEAGIYQFVGTSSPALGLEHVKIAQQSPDINKTLGSWYKTQNANFVSEISAISIKVEDLNNDLQLKDNEITAYRKEIDQLKQIISSNYLIRKPFKSK